MNKMPGIAGAMTLAAIAVGSVAPLAAQDNLNRTVDQFNCREVMREPSSNREVMIAFLHGYLLGRSGSQAFNLDTLHKQTEAFVEHCLSNPNGKAIDSMTTVKK